MDVYVIGLFSIIFVVVNVVGLWIECAPKDADLASVHPIQKPKPRPNPFPPAASAANSKAA